MKSKGDDALMIELQAGNAGAFDEIVRRYQGPLMAYIRRRAPRTADHEGIVQEAFLRVFKSLWSYSPTNDFRGWMFSIARNLVIDEIRREARSLTLAAVDVNSVPACDERESDDSADILCVLHGLPTEQRMAFDLHHLAGLSMDEGAMAVDVPVHTFKSRVRLAREKLAERLRIREIAQSV